MAKTGFDISRNQKIGLVALSGMLVALLVLLNIRENAEFNDPFDLSDQELEYYSKKLEPEKSSSFTRQNSKEKSPSYQLFNFDPNELDQAGFRSLGFSEKQSESIVSYRTNYGPFHSKEDFGKLYVVSDEKFEELSPYILISSNENSSRIDINLASAEELQKIKGIGPAYSDRIVKYRDLLGGFTSEEQFTEVYGLTEETAKLLRSETVIDPAIVRKINVNEATKNEMKKHPYMDFEMVALILEERNKGKLINLDFLNGQVSSEKVEKIRPYLSFE